MHNSKLLSLIGALQQEELHWLQKFLKSPFYNTNELHIQLFDHIRKYYPELSSPKLSKENTFKKLFPKEKINVQKIRKVMYGLATLTEEFLVAMQLRQKPFEKKKLLIKDLGERNVYPLFEKGTKELLKELEDLSYRDVNYYKEVHELNLDFYGHFQTNKQKGNNSVLVDASDHLNYYYLMQRQRLDITVKWHEKLIGDKFRIKNLTQSEQPIQEIAAYQLYELNLKALSTINNKEIYLAIEDLFKKEVTQLGRNDQLEIYRILLNYLNSKISKGDISYRAKVLSLYKFGLQQDLIIQNEQFSEITFINIASNGIAEKEFEWVESFITEYKYRLPEGRREKVISFVLITFYFYKKEYEKTIDLVLSQSLSKHLLILISKTILTRAYFELFLTDDSYYDLLISQLHAFERSVRRNEAVSQSKKETYLNFISFTRKITNAHFQKSVDKSLYISIQKSESVALKGWLLEKVESLI